MAEKLGKTVLFRMNGVAPGFLREYGCRSCAQCSSSKPQAHISASLIIKDSWEAKRRVSCHILFDCGLGAIDSLIDFGAPPVDHVCVSHGHPYHSLGFDRLVWGQVRHGGRMPLPVYCTGGTYDCGPGRIYPWFFKEGRLLHKSVKPLEPVPLESDPGIPLKITPVPVYQGEFAPGAVIWVVEFGDEDAGTDHKLVLAWELIHFIPRFSEEDHVSTYEPYVHANQSRILNAYGFSEMPKQFPKGLVTKKLLLADHYGPLLSDVEELYFDGNTRTPRDDTHHMSIQAAFRFLIPQTKAKRAWIAHYSGHEDPGGPMSDEDLQDWVDQEKQDDLYQKNPRDRRVKNADVRVAKHGMVLTYEV